MAVLRDPDGFLSRAPVVRAVVVKLWRRRDGFFAPPYRRLAKRSSGKAFSGVSPILLVSLTTCIDPLPPCSDRLPLDTQPHSGPTLVLWPVSAFISHAAWRPPTHDETQDQKESFSPVCPHPSESLHHHHSLVP
jgi:hypothetical protein